MKKTWIALAVAGVFTGAAHAQSSVTLYGIADVNVQVNDPDVPNVATTTGINSGHQSGSRFGLRGSEDLGGGLSAVFTLEGGYNIDQGTSAQGGRLFGRQAWAGLRGGFGTVALGRVATLSSGTGSFDMFGSVDPFLTGFGISALASTFTMAGAVRVDNSILYQSNQLGPVRFGAMHSFNINGGEVPGASNNTRLSGAALNLNAGPIWATVTYDQVNNPAAGSSDAKYLQVGVKATFGPATISAAWAKEDDLFLNLAASNSATNGSDARSYMVGGTLKVGPSGSLLASFQRRNVQKIGAVEPEKKVWSVGYTHALSRRTNLYATFADSDGEKSLNNNPAVDLRQYTIGMRHLF